MPKIGQIFNSITVCQPLPCEKDVSLPTCHTQLFSLFANLIQAEHVTPGEAYASKGSPQGKSDTVSVIPAARHPLCCRSTQYNHVSSACTCRWSTMSIRHCQQALRRSSQQACVTPLCRSESAVGGSASPTLLARCGIQAAVG